MTFILMNWTIVKENFYVKHACALEKNYNSVILWWVSTHADYKSVKNDLYKCNKNITQFCNITSTQLLSELLLNYNYLSIWTLRQTNIFRAVMLNNEVYLDKKKIIFS